MSDQRRSKPSQEKLIERIGYRFNAPEVLQTALTHSSVTAPFRGKTTTRTGKPSARDNERLEFLGDRVLALVIAEELCRRFPESAEGELAPRFNALVRKETCAEVARSLDLGSYLHLGGGEAAGGGRDKTAILGDACEAVIAAIYLDGGLAPARDFVLRFWADHFSGLAGRSKDPKSTLQEWAQGRRLAAPNYREVERSGPDHAPHFRVEVEIEGYPGQAGEGTSKRAAEQSAADAFLLREGLQT